MRIARCWPQATLTPAALLAALFQVNVAQANPFTSHGVGLFLGLDLADLQLTWGAEALATFDPEYDDCPSEPRTAYGPITRFTLHGASRPEFQFAGFAGKELDLGGPAVLAELGGTLAFPHGFEDDAALTPHSGVGLEFSIINIYLRQEWLIKSFPIGLGARFMPALGEPGTCSIGRPQRDARGQRTAARGAGALGPALRRGRVSGRQSELAREFRSLAQQEYESVPAFVQLASELAALGAPTALVQRALKAARQELEHTALCAQLARSFGRDAFVPTPPTIQHRAALRGRQGLERLAVESWLDGCLGEGLAAQLARDVAECTGDPGVRRAHLQIAADEHQHAELGWDVLDWCIATEPAVRASVQARRGQCLMPPCSPLAAAGRRAEVADRQRRAAKQRLAAC